MPVPDYVVFLNGAYGVGKSSTLDHVGDLLADAGRAFSLMDVDWFHRSWPPADHDPENVLVEAANLAAVWRGYRRAGPRLPVVAGVIASESDRQRYARVFDRPVRSVRLVARAEVTQARLRRRYAEQQQRALDWHLERHVELAEKLTSIALDELVIDTDDLDARTVAATVLRHFDLLPLVGQPRGRGQDGVMTLNFVEAAGAPEPVGPYSHAVAARGELVFLSGQTPIDPASQRLVDGDVAAQVRQVFTNLEHVLSASGVAFRDVVKVNVFLVDMNDFAAMNDVYAAVFDAPHPARTTVAVAGLPLGARVEIELVALRA